MPSSLGDGSTKPGDDLIYCDFRSSQARLTIDHQPVGSDDLNVVYADEPHDVAQIGRAEIDGAIHCRPTRGDGNDRALAILQRRELLRVAGELSNDLGKPFVEAKIGARIEGKIARRIDMANGQFALVEKSREFTLVPWRTALEKQIGKQASGIMRADGINWRFGRLRAGPEIS